MNRTHDSLIGRCDNHYSATIVVTHVSCIWKTRKLQRFFISHFWDQPVQLEPKHSQEKSEMGHQTAKMCFLILAHQFTHSHAHSFASKYSCTNYVQMSATYLNVLQFLSSTDVCMCQCKYGLNLYDKIKNICHLIVIVIHVYKCS